MSTLRRMWQCLLLILLTIVAALATGSATAQTISVIEPTSGSALGGTLVTITGTGFTGTTAVTFGSTPASFTEINDNQIWATSPAGTGTVDVTVTTPNGTSLPDAASQFTYTAPLPTPDVTGLSPDGGPEIGGTVVTITGTSFTGATTVSFGSSPAVWFTVNSDVEIVAIAPVGTGTVDVTVTTPSGTSAADSNSEFTYIPPGPPQDSVDAETIQNLFSPIAAKTSGHAIGNAAAKGIALGLSGGSGLGVSGDGGFLAYAPMPAEAPKRAVAGILEAEEGTIAFDHWSLWLDAQGSGLFDLAAGTGSDGWQLNLTGGVGYRLDENIVVGALGGYEIFHYESDVPAGRLEGSGYSVGAYVGADATEDILVDLSLVRTSLGYDVASGAATGSFDSTRWLISGGLAGSYELGEGFTVEPSGRIFALWEEQASWTDSLATVHPERDLGLLRGSLGVRLSRALPISDGWNLVPYVGGHADYQYTHDTAAASPVGAAITGDGLSGRVTTGIDIEADGGALLSLGGQIGGIGSNLLTWSVEGTVGASF